MNWRQDKIDKKINISLNIESLTYFKIQKVLSKRKVVSEGISSFREKKNSEFRKDAFQMKKMNQRL